jgi:hypothetical protein
MRNVIFTFALLSAPLALAAEPAAPVKLEVMWMGLTPPEGSRALPAAELKVSASSELCEGKGAKRMCHSAARLVDDKLETAWCEGAKEDGEGESVTFEFKAPKEVMAVDVVPYYAKDMRRATGNARPELVVIEVGTQRFEVTFPDHPTRVAGENSPKGHNPDDGPCGDETCASQDERIAAGEHYRVMLPAPVKAQRVRLELRSTHAGDKHPDTCMSAVMFHVR